MNKNFSSLIFKNLIMQLHLEFIIGILVGALFTIMINESFNRKILHTMRNTKKQKGYFLFSDRTHERLSR
jgi:F0F1-type ATP synthase assembly protein I